MSGRIPTRINLPFRYLVRVVQLGQREYTKECGDDSLACWVVEERTIYLRRSRPQKKKRADLAHELGHAFLDFQTHLLGGKHADAKD